MSFTPNYDSDEELAFFTQPGVTLRARQLSAEQIAHIARDLKQFRRAENGERIRPDVTNNSIVTDEHRKANPGWAEGYPTPFAPRDTHRPDRANNPDALHHLRAIDQRIEDEATTYDLQNRMGTDADRPLPPVSLRDQIAAAVTVHNAD